MQLSIEGITKERAAWEAKGYHLPSFDLHQMREQTRKAPVWVHFGAGNIFRAFHAVLAEKLLAEGKMQAGIVAAEGYDGEIIRKTFRPADDLTVGVTLHADGTTDKAVIGGIGKGLAMDDEADREALREIFRAPTLQMVTFTITEKGYATAPYMDSVTRMIYVRYQAGALPCAYVSTDNCSHNGDTLKAAVLASAKRLAEQGEIAAQDAQGFIAYLEDETKNSFPWTMIDKITPRPDASVQEMILSDGVEGAAPIVTEKGTYVATFVNAEESEYLVVEDRFPNGRPPLEEAGVLFTDRETVDRVEKMKVCTCLNPLHTGLAIFGCLLGQETIAQEMKDDDLRLLAEGLGYREGLPVVVNPGILNPEDFLKTVLTVRLPNPFMPDTPQRIATDTSQKLAIRFGETIKAYQKTDPARVRELKLIPLVFAGWLRYLTGIDDEGNAFSPSADPRLQEATAHVRTLSFGTAIAPDKAREALMPLLQDPTLFGVDLTQAGLSDPVIEAFVQMMAEKGAVRRVLHDAVTAA